MKVIISWIIFLFGLAGLFVGIMGIIDPVGSQHANDADPFGAPSPIYYAYFVAAIGIMICAASIYSFLKKK